MMQLCPKKFRTLRKQRCMCSREKRDATNSKSRRNKDNQFGFPGGKPDGLLLQWHVLLVSVCVGRPNYQQGFEKAAARKARRGSLRMP